jgi:hypothetical protein
MITFLGNAQNAIATADEWVWGGGDRGMESVC